MKRTSNGFSRAKRAKRSTSSSVNPRSATALTLIGRSSGWAWAASSPASTRSSESRRVSWKKRSAASESSETLTRRRPARDEVGDLRLEQVAVRGQREVLDAGDRADRPDQPPQLLAHERLAAGQAHVVHAHLGQDATSRAISS